MTAKLAIAERTDGNVYDVTYPGRNDYDKDVSMGYLQGLKRKGWRVLVKQTRHRPEGEPSEYELH
jgi:hypothetical protein